jgi:hypothetical protein
MLRLVASEVMFRLSMMLLKTNKSLIFLKMDQNKDLSTETVKRHRDQMESLLSQMYPKSSSKYTDKQSFQKFERIVGHDLFVKAIMTISKAKTRFAKDIPEVQWDKFVKDEKIEGRILSKRKDKQQSIPKTTLKTRTETKSKTSEKVIPKPTRSVNRMAKKVKRTPTKKKRKHIDHSPQDRAPPGMVLRYVPASESDDQDSDPDDKKPSALTKPSVTKTVKRKRIDESVRSVVPIRLPKKPKYPRSSVSPKKGKTRRELVTQAKNKKEFKSDSSVQLAKPTMKPRNKTKLSAHASIKTAVSKKPDVNTGRSESDSSSGLPPTKSPRTTTKPSASGRKIKPSAQTYTKPTNAKKPDDESSRADSDSSTGLPTSKPPAQTSKKTASGKKTDVDTGIVDIAIQEDEAKKPDEYVGISEGFENTGLPEDRFDDPKSSDSPIPPDESKKPSLQEVPSKPIDFVVENPPVEPDDEP